MPESAATIQRIPAGDVRPTAAAPGPHGEQAFALLVEAVLDYAIYMLGTDGRVLTWNLGAERLKGYAPDEIIGRNFAAFYAPEDVAAGRPRQVLAAAARDGRYEEEGWRVRKDGTRFWADVVVTALRWPDGTLYGFAKVTRDLTERRAAIARETALAAEQRARNAAEEALRARDRFLSIASHELRTPVASLQLATEALGRARRNGHLDERRFEASVRRIERAAERLGTLVSELLDVSRLESGAMPLRLEEVDLGSLAHEVAASLSSDDHRGRIIVDAEAGAATRGDSARLHQVVTNLVDNALKYSEETVRIRTAREDGGARLSVSDSGIGLEEGALPNLFEPFSRATGVTHIPGIGLGLFISRQIVERHGGWIDAHSDGPGRGTTFAVWLPKAPPTAGAVS
jgi:PAS domain S-box-containing protein